MRLNAVMLLAARGELCLPMNVATSRKEDTNYRVARSLRTSYSPQDSDVALQGNLTLACLDPEWLDKLCGCCDTPVW